MKLLSDQQLDSVVAGASAVEYSLLNLQAALLVIVPVLINNTKINKILQCLQK